jgi:radical SAM protein with 4Fe4S-binding SPASM domain
MFDGLHRKARRAWARAGMLFELHCDLLYQCDLDCVHCYLDDKARRILPTDFWRGVFDQAADLGVFSVLLSGGEIFLRRDLLDLIAHARSRGLFVHLKTHGGHIDAAVAGRLKGLGVSTVALSYYATDAAIHDAITRRPGSHAATRAALGHLAAAGVLTVASIPVMTANADAWQEAVAEVEALGVFAGLNGVMAPAHSGDLFPRALNVAEGHLVALERFLLARRRAADGEAACEVEGPEGSARAWEDGASCSAGSALLYVGPEGDVTPCVSWPMPLGNLSRGDRLGDLWRSHAGLEAVRTRRRDARAVCVTCEVREDCSFCAGAAFIETGDPTAATRAACEATRARTLARATSLGLPEPPLPAGLRPGALAQGPARRFPIRVVTRAGEAGP